MTTCLSATALLSAAASAGAQLPPGPGLLPPLPPGTTPPQNPPPSPPPPNPPPGAPVAGTVTSHVDPAHSGYVDDPNLVPPLVKRWSRRFDGAVYAIRWGDGRLYLLDGSGSKVVAIDPATGKDIWRANVTGSDIGYEDGRLFVGGGDGVLRALSAADGRVIWERKLSEYYGIGAAVPAGGVVYVSANGSLVALRASDGTLLWGPKGDGTDNIPAIDGEKAYMAWACAQVGAFRRSNGERAWHHSTECSGGGGSTPAIYNGRLYVPERSLILDAANGQPVGKFPGLWTPIFARGLGLFLQNGTFTAQDMSNGATRWRHQAQDDSLSYYGRMSITPVAVGRSVYRVTPRGTLYSLRLDDGVKTWSEKAPHEPTDGGSSGGELSVAPGLLLVPGGRMLTAYQSYFRPGAREIAAAPLYSDIEHRFKNAIDGVVGSELRAPGTKVTLEADEVPYGGYREIASAAMQSDGFFSFGLRTERNTRVRVRAGGVTSPVIDVFTYPAVRYKVRQNRAGVVRAGITLTTSRDVGLGGRRAYLYIGRVKQKRLDRLGSARLRSADRGKASGVVTFRALRSVGRKDYLAVCVAGQHRLGLGRPDRTLKRCGRARIGF